MDQVSINGKQFQLLISTHQLDQRIQNLATEINQDYAKEPPLLLAILNGAFIFAADLIRKLTISPEIQFLKASSYRDQMKSSGRVEFEQELASSIRGRHILMIEDIVDTGKTSQALREYLAKEKAQSVKMVSLLFKPTIFQGIQAPEYVGFEIPPSFVVGYGLDFAQKGRELPAIYQLIEPQ